MNCLAHYLVLRMNSVVYFVVSRLRALGFELCMLYFMFDQIGFSSKVTMELG